MVLLKFMAYLLAVWCNLSMHIHDDVFVCYFEMLAVGLRCELFPSSRGSEFLL